MPRWCCTRRGTDARLKHGQFCGLFLIGYSFSRIPVEFFREPDAQSAISPVS
jgi:prolipoprotein diacylglyceryltransferase